MIAAPHRTAWLLAISLLALCLGLPATHLQAQYRYKWLTIGRLHSPYSEAGALREEEADTDNQLAFPAIELTAGNKRSEALWVAVTDFTDENGKLWPVKIAHVGPRRYGGRYGGDPQFFTREFKLVSRFEPPVVRVNGNISFRYWSVVDEVDPALKADRMIYIRNVNRVGIELEQKIYAFDQEFHDNYHIIEYTFANTGDVDEDLDVELPNQVLNGVYFFWLERYGFSGASAWVTGGGAPWGQYVMNDAVGDGHEDYGVNFTAHYTWAGYRPDQTAFNSLGQPMFEPLCGGWISWPYDTSGRLDKGHFAGRVYIHADMTADVEDNAVDPTPEGTWPDGADPERLAGRQPSTMGFINSENADLADDEYNENLMIRQYNERIAAGRAYPHHADLVEPSDPGEPPGQYFPFPRNDPSNVLGIHDQGGWSSVKGFGPYSMKPGDDVRLVVATGVAGLSDSAKLMIGIAYKDSEADDSLLIEWPPGSGVSMTKNQWVLTSRDSIFQMFERAIANYESGFDIPKAHMPPATFDVTSSGKTILLAWTTYPGEPDPVSWEVWRTSPIYHNSAYYEKIAALPGSARSYTDAVGEAKGPVMNLEHFYYIQAVGPVNTDPTGNTPTGVLLKSNRYYTQTYFPVMPGRPAGEELKDFVIVPNPYHIGADPDIRYPDRQDKLGFLDIPGYCTIRIYTQLGELVDTIVHYDGTGDEYWDHTTASRQVVVSGLYIAVITDTETNEKVMKKFVIIR